MRKMSLRREIQIQRKQNKNKMVGQTFNPSGITSEQIRERENKFITDLKNKTQHEREQYWKEREQVRQIWIGSWPWEWCIFERNFIDHKGAVI